jgi:hypothetical protein
MGWGRRNNDPNDRGNLTNTGAFSNILQQLIVPQVPTQQCKKFPSFQDINEQKQICAGGEPGIYLGWKLNLSVKKWHKLYLMNTSSVFMAKVLQGLARWQGSGGQDFFLLILTIYIFFKHYWT